MVSVVVVVVVVVVDSVVLVGGVVMSPLQRSEVQVQAWDEESTG